MARHAIIVEFMGIPGSGKSSLASALVQKLSTTHPFDAALPDRFDYRRKQLTWFEKVRLDVMYAPSFLMYRIRRLFFDISNMGLGFWIVGNSWRQSRYPIVLLDLVRLAPRRFYILDEWLMHRTIEESIKRYNSNVSFSRKFAIPHIKTHCLVYVCVHVDRELARERILNQDQPFRFFAKKKDGCTIEEILALWDHQVQQLQLEIDRRRLVCIDIDGSAPIEFNVQLLLDRLSGVSRKLATDLGVEVKSQ